MKQEEDKFTGLPENAFRELKPGEVYNPLMSPSKNYPEVNFWSVAWGIAGYCGSDEIIRPIYSRMVSSKSCG